MLQKNLFPYEALPFCPSPLRGGEGGERNGRALKNAFKFPCFKFPTFPTPPGSLRRWSLCPENPQETKHRANAAHGANDLKAMLLERNPMFQKRKSLNVGWTTCLHIMRLHDSSQAQRHQENICCIHDLCCFGRDKEGHQQTKDLGAQIC